MKIELHITLDPANGKVEVQGPLTNKMPLVYMLEEAKRLIQNFDPAQKPGPPPLLVARGSLPVSPNGGPK